MQRALDNGAEGIIIPCLKSIDDFRKVVELGMTFTTTTSEARMYIDKGFDAVAYSIDTIVIGRAQIGSRTDPRIGKTISG